MLTVFLHNLDSDHDLPVEEVIVNPVPVRVNPVPVRVNPENFLSLASSSGQQNIVPGFQSGIDSSLARMVDQESNTETNNLIEFPYGQARVLPENFLSLSSSSGQQNIVPGFQSGIDSSLTRMVDQESNTESNSLIEFPYGQARVLPENFLSLSSSSGQQNIVPGFQSEINSIAEDGIDQLSQQKENGSFSMVQLSEYTPHTEPLDDATLIFDSLPLGPISNLILQCGLLLRKNK